MLKKSCLVAALVVSLGFLASARLTNEENYLIQKLARAVVGTNSVHSCEST